MRRLHQPATEPHTFALMWCLFAEIIYVCSWCSDGFLASKHAISERKGWCWEFYWQTFYSSNALAIHRRRRLNFSIVQGQLTNITTSWIDFLLNTRPQKHHVTQHVKLSRHNTSFSSAETLIRLEGGKNSICQLFLLLSALIRFNSSFESHDVAEA